MKLGSHNTMTYLKPLKWYMYPFQFIARCQSKDIEELYELGVRWFDLRISFNKYGNPEFRHGLISYKGNVFKILDYLNTKKDVIVRILLEKDHPFYKEFCKHIENTYTNIKFSGGLKKSTWESIYTFKNSPIYTLEERYSSMPENPKWCSIFPYLYSIINNNKPNKTNSDFLVLDFIQLWKN